MNFGPSTTIPLKRTWYEISDYLQRSPDALAVLKLVNFVTPRSWVFTFGFDSCSRTLLTIQCDPPLLESELFTLVDGTVAELFLSDQLVLHQDSYALHAQPRQLLSSPPPTNLLPVTARPVPKSGPALMLIGFFGTRLPSRIQDGSSIRRRLLERTWFGSTKFCRKPYTVTWTVLGRSEIFRPTDRLSARLGSGLLFRQYFSITDSAKGHLGEACLATSAHLGESRAFHSRFGEFDPVEIAADFWSFGAQTDDHWLVEIDEPSLTLTLGRHLAPSMLLKTILDCVKLEASNRLALQDFQNYILEKAERKARETADALTARQRHAQEAPRVLFRGQELLCLPSGENEVTALLCKLEALKALPFHYFKLLEYTPRRGIDALASFQLEATGQIEFFEPVEVEYWFENFFDHGHLLEQVRLIVCWQFREDEPFVPPSFQLVRINAWLYSLRRGKYASWVLLLSRIPGVELKKGSAT